MSGVVWALIALGAVVALAIGDVLLRLYRKLRAAQQEGKVTAAILRVIEEQQKKEQRQDIGKYDKRTRLLACLQRYQRYATLERLHTPRNIEHRLRDALKGFN